MQHAKVGEVSGEGGKDVKVCMKTARLIESSGRGGAALLKRFLATFSTGGSKLAKPSPLVEGY